VSVVGTYPTPAMPLITPYSRHSIGAGVVALGGGAGASATWPTANKAFYFPFYLYRPEVITRVFVVNGATAANNWDVGIYTAAGARIISSGAVAQSGTNTLQFSDITDTLLGTGAYYMGCSFSNTSGTVFRLAVGDADLLREQGCKVQTSAHVLPATATFAAYDATFLPFFGVAIRSTP
jgi:hypothetical protein